MKNHLRRHFGKMQLTGTNAGHHYLTLEDFLAEWSQLYMLYMNGPNYKTSRTMPLMDCCSSFKVLSPALPLVGWSTYSVILLIWQKNLTLSWCLKKRVLVQFVVCLVCLHGVFCLVKAWLALFWFLLVRIVLFWFSCQFGLIWSCVATFKQRGSWLRGRWPPETRWPR